MMLPRIFIDTGAFLSLEDESDHEAAIQFQEPVLRRRRYGIVTTSYILDETLTLIRFRIGIKASIDFSKKFRKREVYLNDSLDKDIDGQRLF